jgi:uncharacterized protein
MEAAVSNVTIDRLIAMFLAGCFGILASRIAWKAGYYFLPPETPLKREVCGICVFAAFVIFFLCEFFSGALLAALWIFWHQGDFDEDSTFTFPSEFTGWENLIVYAVTCTALVLFFASLKKPKREAIWGSPSEIRSVGRNIKDFFIGSMSWIIAFPWVIVIGQLLEMIFSLFYSGSLPEQTAVEHLKGLFENPWLFGATAVAVVSVVPVIEEMLFRGFLQSWLKPLLGRKKAILLTALIFASFHFSLSQGIENVEFIASLFLLALFLGFVKERQQSLWASIGLHSTFNFISILMLIFEEM